MRKRVSGMSVTHQSRGISHPHSSFGPSPSVSLGHRQRGAQLQPSPVPPRAAAVTAGPRPLSPV